jgi:virulence-associated protein VagC
MEVRMSAGMKTRVFMSGRSQHVTIPQAFRFRAAEVSIRRDEETGEIILREIEPLQAIFLELDAAGVAESFWMGEGDGASGARGSLKNA